MVASLLVLAFAAAAVYAIRIDRSLVENINRQDALPSDGATVAGTSSIRPSARPRGPSSGTPAPAPRPVKQATGTLNYLLLGSDSRDADASGNGRSDTIVLVHLNKKRDKAYIVSWPRDMWVTIPGYGMNKINAAFAFGGPQLTVRTLEELTGDRIDHVVEVDFEGFVQLTDDLGGVKVNNEHAFSSHGFDYPKGEITIQGKEALWFVRERKSLPRGDLDRAENQRKVIKAIVAKGLSAGTVSNPARFTAFLSGVAQHVTVDSTLSDAEIRSTALSLRLRGSDIETLQAPISGLGTSPDGQSIDVVDPAKLRELSKALRTDTVDDYLEKYPQG